MIESNESLVVLVGANDEIRYPAAPQLVYGAGGLVEAGCPEGIRYYLNPLSPALGRSVYAGSEHIGLDYG
jgi:hypothetical protein